MKKISSRTLQALFGVAATLGWCILTGCEIGSAASMKIPTKVWEGGAGTLTIEAELSCPPLPANKESKDSEKICQGYLQVRFLPSFESGPRSRPQSEAMEHVPEGRHAWTIDVPADTHAFLTLGIHPAEVGSALKLRVKVNGRAIVEKAETLDQPLNADDTFFLSAEFADVAQGKLES